MIIFLICFLACVVGAICGIGGGVIIKPVLDAVGDMEVAAVNFLSGCTVLCMTMYSVLRSKAEKASRIEIRTSGPLAVGAAVGGIFGKKLFQMLCDLSGNADCLNQIQSACLLLVTFATLLYTIKKDKIKTRHIENWAVCLFVGLGLGLISAFLGIGGGPINLVALFFCFSMDTKTAAENSLYIILFSQIASLLCSILTRTVPEFSLLTLGLMVAGGIFGGVCGRKINAKIDGHTVDTLFMGLMLFMIVLNAYNLISFIVPLVY